MSEVKWSSFVLGVVTTLIVVMPTVVVLFYQFDSFLSNCH
jgi:hypothetical protein